MKASLYAKQGKFFWRIGLDISEMILSPAGCVAD
jgi:hypothetical protein